MRLLAIATLTICCACTRRAEPPRTPAIRSVTTAEADLHVGGLSDASCMTSSTSGMVEVNVTYGQDGTPRLVHVLGTDHPRDDELRCIGTWVAERPFPHALYADVTGTVRWNAPKRSPESMPTFYCDKTPSFRGRATVIRRKDRPVQVTIDEPRDLSSAIRTCLTREILRGEPADAWRVPLSYGVVFTVADGRFADPMAR